jgi:hypothetical protein
MLNGLKYQLFDHIHHASWFSVYVPAVVLEELVANHARAVAKVEAAGEQLNRDRRLVGLPPLDGPGVAWDYRKYVEERFDERLSFTVLQWPETPHEDLATRAVRRTRPFNEKGTGYRDALVWADVVELAREGHDVAFVSMDKAFVGEHGGLASELQAEVDPLKGSVELVRDFSRWLIAALPWKSVPDLAAAVSFSRTSEFYDWYLKSDFQDGLEPTVEEFGFSLSPYRFEIVEVVWDGEFVPVEGGVTDDDGLTLVEYELGQSVAFRAEFPEGIEPELGWQASPPDGFRRQELEGAIEMVLRVAVLYGGDFGFSVEELSWRRADGVGPGAAVYHPQLDPQQGHIFESTPEGQRV